MKYQGARISNSKVLIYKFVTILDFQKLIKGQSHSIGIFEQLFSQATFVYTYEISSSMSSFNFRIFSKRGCSWCPYIIKFGEGYSESQKYKYDHLEHWHNHEYYRGKTKH